MNLFSALSINASGLAAQRARAEVLAENLANAETTRTPEGGAYRRKDVVFSSVGVTSPFASQFESALGEGVAVTDIVVDDQVERRYLPHHPDANADGYVEFPRINAAEEMVDMMDAARNYEANVSAMSAIKDMIHRSLDLFR